MYPISHFSSYPYGCHAILILLCLCHKSETRHYDTSSVLIFVQDMLTVEVMCAPRWILWWKYLFMWTFSYEFLRDIVKSIEFFWYVDIIYKNNSTDSWGWEILPFFVLFFYFLVFLNLHDRAFNSIFRFILTFLHTIFSDYCKFF